MDNRIAVIEENRQHAVNMSRLYLAYMFGNGKLRNELQPETKAKDVLEQIVAKKLSEGELYWASLNLNEPRFYNNADTLMGEHTSNPFKIVIGSSNLAHLVINYLKDSAPKTFFMIYGPSFVRGLDWTARVDGHILRAPNLEIPQEKEEIAHPIKTAFKGYYNSLMRILTCPNITCYAYKRNYEALRNLFPEIDKDGRKEVLFFEEERK